MNLRCALAFEWTKLASTRSTRWALAVLTILTPLFAVIVAATGSIQDDDTIFGGGLTGVVQAQLLGGVVGALVMSIEYTSGTIGTTLTAVPRRRVLYAAKVILVTATLFTTTLVSSLAAFLIGLGMLDGETHAVGEPWPALVGVAAAVATVGLLGLAVATLVRSTAGAIVATAGVMFVPLVVSPFFGDYKTWIAGASPISVVQKLAQSSDAVAESAGSVGGWPSLAGLVLVTGAGCALAQRVLDHRDA